MKKNSIKAWLYAARPKTLTGAATPVIMALSMTYAYRGWLNIWPAILCLLFAFFMQIAANFINDYYDFVKGSDRKDRLGPERACAQGWVSLTAMKIAIAVVVVLAGLVGMPLIIWGGAEMVVVGVVCVFAAFLYTMKFSYSGLGDVLVLIFFGFVPVSFTYYLQTSMWDFDVMIISIACGMAIDALLMVNNYRDRVQDVQSGKKTIVVRLGEVWGERLYLLVGVVAYLLTSVVWFNHLPVPIFTLLYLFLHIRTWRKMVLINKGTELNVVLGLTARNIFIFGLLFGIGMLIPMRF